MAGTQHYSLRWNNHQSHVLNAFDALLQNEALVDCTLVCEDTSIRAHKVVLSACSPYFQKIFTDNPCKHPIIVLKDVRGWEVQCIVDFMYKGETSVPESQLTSLIKAAESLKVRGLTSSDQSLPPGLAGGPTRDGSRSNSRHNSPMPGNFGASRSLHYSPSPARYPPSNGGGDNQEGPVSKVPHMSSSDQSSPMSLTTHDPEARRSAEERCSASSASARASPGPAGSGPRRKQARPRRRSGDSIGNASLDLSKADSPPFRKSPAHLDDATPENLSMKRPSSSPAINLVKTEALLEDGRHAAMSDNLSEASSAERDHARIAAAAALAVSSATDDHNKPPTPSNRPDHFLSAFHGNGLHQREHEDRVEALQALNMLNMSMARGMGLPHLPHPHGGHPLAGHPGVNGAPHLPTHHALTSSAGAVIGRPTSTPSTGSTNNAFNGLDIFESPLKKKRRRSLSQSLSPQEHLTQILMNLPTATKLNINNNEDQKRGKSPCGVGLFGNSSPLGPPSSSTTHGTSAGFCNICQKYVSNRTNHKYVHSQVKFKCKICGFLYSRKDTLKDHIRGKHNPRYSTTDLNSLVEVVPPSNGAIPTLNGRKN